MSILNNKSLAFVYMCFIVNSAVGTPELRIDKLSTEQKNELNKICGGLDVSKQRDTGASSQFKVVGNKAIPKEFPWTVRLRFYVTAIGGHACSGVLITQQHLLTSAHCFFDSQESHSTLIKRNAIVFAARVNMENVPKIDSNYIPNDIDKTYEIIGVKFHPCYKINQPINYDIHIDSHYAYDIVIAQFDRPLELELIDQQLALPACLPTSKETGWGRDISFSGFGMNDTLQWSMMERVGCDWETAWKFPFILCFKPVGRLYYDEHGDSGGGLIQKGATSQWHVIGVYHGLAAGKWAAMFNSQAEAFIPVLYSLDWINKQLGIDLEKF